MKDEQNSRLTGVKRTKQRESVLSILERSEKPLSAAEIHFKMGKDSDSAASLSTVYRILELFVNKGIAVKTNVMHNEMAIYELNRLKHRHYAVCVNCHKIIAMDNCPMEKFKPELEDKDFFIIGHNLELFGLCKDCNQD